MAKKIILIAVVLLVLLVVVTGLVFWRYPLATFAWLYRRELVKTGFTRTVVQTPVGPQVLYEAGQGSALIFLHGAGDQAGAWHKIAPPFASDHRVLVLDMAGHGESAPQSGALSLAQLRDGLTQVIAERAGSGGVTLIGNSLGGWVAMLYAREHPERVERVVLINGGPLRGDRPDLSLTPRTREEARKVFDALLDPGSPRVPDFILDDIVRASASGPIGRMAQNPADMQQYVVEDAALTQFTVPVDVVWGEADRMLGLDYVRRMEAGLPAVRVSMLPRCGHVPQAECPNTLLAKLREVLSQPAPARKGAVPVTATAAGK